jgi:ketosteroid isomerase-like protein
MTDHQAIQTLHSIYAEGSSIGDFDQVTGCFTEDGIWDAGVAGVHQGRENMAKFMAGFVSQFAYYIQTNSPAIISVDGDTATSRATVRECGKFRGRDEALEVMGYYNDDLIRTPGGWKFTRRRFTGLGAHRFALMVGPAIG